MPILLIELAFLAGVAGVVGVAFNLIEYGSLKFIKQARAIRKSRDPFHAVLYLGTYAVASAAVTSAVFSELLIVRIVAIAAIFALLLLDRFCRAVLGDNVGFNEVQTTLSESTFAGQFIASHGSSIVRSALVAGATAIALLLAGHWSPIHLSARWLLLIPLAAVMVYSIIWRTIAATDVFPSPLRLPMLLIYAWLNALKSIPREKIELTVAGLAADRPRVILFILDESVTGEYLSINGAAKPTTPYLESIADQYVNLGIASAASNISAATNVILRSGLRVDQLPDRRQLGLRLPSLYQYAQAAGYRTCYLDAQYPPGVRGNFLTQHDLQTIDELYWAIGDEPDTNKRFRRDRLLLERILARLKDDQPTFLWVNKYGAHIHFDQTYPPEATVFTPTMPPGRSMDGCTQEQIENSYANSLRWAVDDFLHELIPALDLKNSVVVYTSDHGQSIRHGTGNSTHADRIDPPPIQANVPMLGFGRSFETRFSSAIDALRDRTSHFQLFPTLLALMGYDESEVTARYGNPLWAAPPERRVFLSGDVFGRGIVHLNDFDQDAPKRSAEIARSK
jgi:glucan phosphoethanolaminetransferase (alkaline phosphatase superfamily)